MEIIYYFTYPVAEFYVDLDPPFIKCTFLRIWILSCLFGPAISHFPHSRVINSLGRKNDESIKEKKERIND
jgi:hypothetical protein